jgi:hypothetical protein
MKIQKLMEDVLFRMSGAALQRHSSRYGELIEAIFREWNFSQLEEHTRTCDYLIIRIYYTVFRFEN